MQNAPEKVKFLDRLTPRFLLEVKKVFREGGIKAVIQRFGWKIFAAFFAYYLIRDVTLYILLPWYLANKLV
ncbi:hypothetical protein [Bdellovibrio sp. HCB2-146]|uniref:hypothetical protein n=1 Tax=Bdellovibrio sp. HCB2-146 TaxID=3394362 RepID=UPI0039BD414D